MRHSVSIKSKVLSILFLYLMHVICLEAQTIDLTREDYDALIMNKKEYSQQKALLDSLLAEVGKEQSAISSLYAKIESIQAKAMADSAKIVKLQQKLEDLEEELKPLRANKAKMETNLTIIGSIQEEIAQLELKKDSVERQSERSRQEHAAQMERLNSAERQLADLFIQEYQLVLDESFENMSEDYLREGIRDCQSIDLPDTKDMAKRLETLLFHKLSYENAYAMLTRPYSKNAHLEIVEKLQSSSKAQSEDIDRLLSQLSSYQQQAKKLKQLLSQIDNNINVAGFREDGMEEGRKALRSSIDFVIGKNASDIEIFSNNEYLKGLYEQYLKDINENPFNVNTEVQLIIRSFVTE